jgi:hypothetical protein
MRKRSPNDHSLLADEDCRISRLNPGESEVTLRAEHLPTGVALERSVNPAAESEERRTLLADLAAAVARQYPADDFVIEHLYKGPGKGCTLVIRHVPSGLSVGRDIGSGRSSEIKRDLVWELYRKIRETRDR